ncbi:MAG: hypothetical protein AAF081_01940 [Actinomycetota bacterium]
MSDDRWVVLGLAHPRAGWFSELARWSTAAAVPVDFIKCVSPDEVRARLTGGRPHSALLVGGDVSGLDRDLVDATRTTGAAVIVVDPAGSRDWHELGVDSLLPAPDAADDITWRGHLLAVTGSGGSGTSTVAMGLAQALAGDASNAGMVVLADFARNGELAMLHDAREVVPGVQELAEAHRGARLGSDDVRSMTFDVADRGYDLVLGLRRARDWTAIRPRAFEASLDGLRRAYRHVVADVDGDVEGEAETGSIDIEDRNVIARTTLRHADLVLVVGAASTKGVHSLCRELRQLGTYGVPVERMVPVLNRAPRSPRKRAEFAHALSTLVGPADELDGLRSPIHVPERRDLEDAFRDGVRIPAAIGHATHGVVTSLLDEHGARGLDVSAHGPVPVAPGSLGSWTHGEDDA